MKFDGVLTALITPFKQGKVDIQSLKKLVRDQLAGGINGFVINGTTAESPTLTPDEVKEIYKAVAEESDRSVPLVLGAGSNSTAAVLENLKLASQLKPDALLIVTPYYNKPPQRGIIEHFKAIAEASKFPLILYNVPGRTVVSMSADTVGTLAKVSGIIGVKEASGNMDLLNDIQARVSKQFLLSSGDDSSCMEFAYRGGHGVISVISHLIPEEMTKIFASAKQQEKGALVEYKKFDRLNQLVGIESNPIPVKMALYLKGTIASPELRLPLTVLSDENKSLMIAELENLGLK